MSYDNEIDEPVKDDEAKEQKGKLRLSDEEIIAFVRERESKAERLDIQDEQADAMDAYLRRPYGNEEEGRSQFISSDVFDVVEGLTPNVIEPFIISSDIVQFNPEGAEDEEAAKQESDYVNYVITAKNDAFTQFLAWVKVGLLQKNGVVKWWWDKTHRVNIETYRGITADVLSSFLQDGRLEVIGLSIAQPETPIPDLSMTPIAGAAQEATQAPPEPTYDVRLRARNEDGCGRFKVVPPESLLVIGDDPNIQKAKFVQHRERVTLSDLREMGYDIPDDLSDAGHGDTTYAPTYTARTQDQQTFNTGTPDDSPNDPAMKEVWYCESYCYLDLDGDGISELRKICTVGSNVLAKDETEEIPFGSWTPFLQPFQWDGRCPADEAIEFQDYKTTLVRLTLDNLYTINNNQRYVGNKVNLDDLLENRIAGVVRVDAADIRGQIADASITPIGQVTMPMVEYADASKETRTGFTRANQGSADLGNQKTLGEIRIVSQAGNKRTQLVIRSMAEQGVRTLMLGMHGLLRRHATKAETIRLRGKWVTIDPRDWKERRDMTVSIQDANDVQLKLGAQSEIIKQVTGFGIPAGVATPENLYNAASRYVELTGEKNPDKYFTHPDKIPPKQAPDPMQDPKFRLDASNQAFAVWKGEQEVRQKDRELDQVDRELDQADAQLGIEAQNAQLDALNRQHEMQLKTEVHARDMQAPHPQELAAGNQALQAQQQEHQQGVDQAQLAQSQQQIDQPAEPATEDGQ